ncbi:MAG: hypothetical protein AAB914_02545 [Patescibacteria group bacterium]
MKIVESPAKYEEIGFRELRTASDDIIAGVGQGKSYIVKRKSKALFKIVPLEEAVWETVIDFTEISPKGVDADELLVQMDILKHKNPKKYGR